MSNNEVFLQGWMVLQRAGILHEDGRVIIHAHLDTDKPYLGGRHPVVLDGKPAQLALALLHEHGPHLAIQAVVHGRLVTLWRDGQPRSAIVARYVTFLGEPKTLRKDTGTLVPPWGVGEDDGSSAYRPAGRSGAA